MQRWSTCVPRCRRKRPWVLGATILSWWGISLHSVQHQASLMYHKKMKEGVWAVHIFGRPFQLPTGMRKSKQKLTQTEKRETRAPHILGRPIEFPLCMLTVILETLFFPKTGDRTSYFFDPFLRLSRVYAPSGILADLPNRSSSHACSNDTRPNI